MIAINTDPMKTAICNRGKSILLITQWVRCDNGITVTITVKIVQIISIINITVF